MPVAGGEAPDQQTDDQIATLAAVSAYLLLCGVCFACGFLSFFKTIGFSWPNRGITPLVVQLVWATSLDASVLGPRTDSPFADRSGARL